MQLHELCRIFPPLDDESYKALRDDIKAHGLRNPIVVYNDQVLDGQNRLRACQELEIEPKFIEFINAEQDLVDFVLAQNLHRRHLKPGQAATIVALAQDWSKAHLAGRAVANEKKETVEERTKQSGASRRTQLTADKLVKEAPELAKKVANGEVSLNQASKKLTPEEVTTESDSVQASDDDEFDLADLYEQEVRENKRLHSLIEALSSDDSAKEIVLLHEKIKALEGRLSKSIQTETEAVKQAKYYAKLLTSIRSLLGCEQNSDILLRIKALK